MMQERMRSAEAKFIIKGLKKILAYVENKYIYESDTELRIASHHINQAIFHMTDYMEGLKHDERIEKHCKDNNIRCVNTDHPMFNSCNNF